jgi:SAM-dependent methyltransferase
VTTDYLLDNQNQHARSRFDELEVLFDPITAHMLRTLPLTHGARCWEVGAGSGSVASHLYRRVKPLGGHVLATDIDLGLTRRDPGIVYTQHDVELDEPPHGPWDLIHARLVIQHLNDPTKVIHHLVGQLRRGGWLVVEELDPVFPYAPDPVLAGEHLINRVGNAFTALLENHAHPKLGRRLHREFVGAGLDRVVNRGHVIPCVGGSPGTRLMQVNIQQTANKLRKLGITIAEINEYVDLLNDPTVDLMLPVYFSAKGQRP